MHFLCASISALQFSSPLPKTHSSRIVLVAGQAQHGLHFGLVSAIGGLDITSGADCVDPIM